ncbi:MAG TPA: ABC transporter ATP-binding protein [Christensenellaceae bacterium]|nr:ABC transporter ATP-binding protein [Christensenellaceae bacterium]
MRRQLVRLLGFTKNAKLSLVVLVISGIAGSVCSLLAPVFIGKAIDSLALFNVDFPQLFNNIIILAALYISSAFFEWLLMQSANNVGYRTAEALRQAGYEKLHTLPISSIDRGSRGDFTSRIIIDTQNVSQGLIQGLPKMVQGVSAIVGTMISMAIISLPIALTVALLTPLSVLVARKITLSSHEHYVMQAEAQGDFSGFITERISNRDIISAFYAHEGNIKSFNKYNETLTSKTYTAQLYGALVNPSTRFVNHIVYVSVGLVGSLLSLAGLISIGQVSSLLFYTNQYTKPFNEISGVIHQLQSAYAAVGRVFALLDRQNEKEDYESPPEYISSIGNVDFQNVHFSYEKSKPLIREFSLKVKPGEKIAIVGETGAGKTTIVNLLMRFYDIDSGDIKIDGNSIYRIKRSQLRSMFAMVLQDSWLFSGTVRDNIAFGKPDATMEEIISAAKCAHAHGFISRLPNGYDTLLSGEMGLSGGQMQLLCIARVLINNPPILILDEATSSVDTRTEMLVNRAFDDMMKGRTSFIIAHRLSTIRSADRILVMKDGAIAEQGNHDSLIKQKGIYYDMYNSQFIQE